MSNTVLSQGELGDFFELRHGFAFPGSAFSDEGELLVVKIKNIKPGRLDLSKQEFIPADYLATHGGYMPKAGDLLVSLSGNRYEGNPETWVGKVCLYTGAPRCLINQRVGILRKKEGVEVDSRYFSYLLSTLDAQQSLIQIATSSGGQANLSTKQLLDFEVLVAPPADQKAIAHILGTLDDKIELNRKTNETLEAMAKALFKSWFVDFDPVRAKAEGRPTGLPAEVSDLFPDSFEDSELGEIPSGWKIKKIGDIISRLPVGKRFDQKTVSPKGSIPVLDQSATGIVGYHDEEAGISATKDFPLFTFANHTCALRYMIRPFSVIQNVFPLRGNGVDTAWLYQASQGKQEITEYKGHYPDFIEKQVVAPANGIDKVYGGDYEMILIKCDSNLINSAVLSSTRDALLPKLISGEIRIPDAEKMLEEVGV